MSAEGENPYVAPIFPAAVLPAVEIAPPPRRPRVWTLVAAVIAAIVLSFGIQIVVGIGLAAYLISTGVSPREIQDQLLKLITSPPIFSLLVITGPGTFGVVALLAAWLSPEPWRERLGLLPVRCSRSIYPLSMAGSILPLAAGLALAHLLLWLAPFIPTDQSAKLMYDQMTLEWAIPFVIVIGLVPGFCEEMLFRGYVQKRLHARWGPALAIVIASVVFGAAHIMPHVVIFATLLGFWLGFVASKSGSIWPTIACHVFVNSGLNAWRMVVKFGEVPQFAQWVVEGTALLVGLVCFVLALRLLLTTEKPSAFSDQPSAFEG